MDDAATSPGFMVPSPVESPRFDSYAFRSDDHVPPTSKISHGHSKTPLQLSVYPKAFLLPDNSSSLLKLSPEKDSQSQQNQLSTYPFSPDQGIYPHVQNFEQIVHPSKLENDCNDMKFYQVHLIKQTNMEPLICEKQTSQCQLALSQKTEWNQEEPKKKTKQKKQSELTTEVMKKTQTKKYKAPVVTTASHPVSLVTESIGINPRRDAFSASYTAQTILTREPKVLCAKNAAPTLPACMPSKDSSTILHPVQTPGSFSYISPLPSTTSAATFTNSVCFFSDDRHSSANSFELSSSQPASRMSTMSSNLLEGKTKETSDSVSLSKILEIIEREKSLGSSSPCKRRRTAKPQHIQVAEEEAKKYAAANAAQNIMSGISCTENNQESNKRSEQVNCENMLVIVDQEIYGENVKVVSKAHSPNFKCLEKSNVTSKTNGDNLLQTVNSKHNITSFISHPGYNITHNNSGVETSCVSAEISKLADKISNSDQINTVSKQNSVNNSPRNNQNSFHTSPKGNISQIVSGTAKVNGKLFRPPIQINPQFILSPDARNRNKPAVSANKLLISESSTSESEFHHFDLSTKLEENNFNDLNSCDALISSTVAHSHHMSSLHNTRMHKSDFSSSTKCINWSQNKPLTGKEASASFLDVKVQDLEPSLTYDLSSAWSETPDIITERDSQSLQRLSSTASLAFDAEKPKKRQSSSSTKRAHSSSNSLYLESSRTLPPFDAFAGLKINKIPQSFEFNGESNHLQSINSQTDSALNTETVNTIIKKKVDEINKPVQFPDESKDQKLIKNNNVFQEPLNDNSDFKSVYSHISNRNDLVASADGKTTKPAIYNVSCASDFRLCNPNGKNTQTGPGSNNLNSEIDDVNNTKQCIDQFSDLKFKLGSNRIRQKMIKGHTQIIAKTDNSVRNNIMQTLILDDNFVKTEWTETMLKSTSYPVKAQSELNVSSITSVLDLNSCKQDQGIATHINPSQDIENSANSMLPCSDSSICKPKVDLQLLNGVVSSANGTVPHMNSFTSKGPQSSQPKMDSNLSHISLEEELDDRLRNNRTESAPKCGCLGPNYEFNESIEGPYYTQLGAAKDMPALRAILEKRTGLTGTAIRIEKIHYTGKEGRSVEGCPIAKWIIRRSGPEEKYLCLARKRPGHFCNAAYIVVVIVAWEGVVSEQADSLYNYLVSTLTKNGFETDRRCGTNERKTCACQGIDLIRRGASFSFGCSWSMYFNGCKFARSHVARKFKLKDIAEEEKIEEHLQNLATKVGPLYKIVAPDAYRNQTHFEEQANMCRLGKEKGKPFSGVTACVDFCAHSHKDFHNMQNGSTVVVTLTKHRGWSKPDDEQLHVLPLYVMDNTDEHGSIDEQMKKVQNGALEILQKYSLQARMRVMPLKKNRRCAKKDSPVKSIAGSPSGGSASALSTHSTLVTPTKEREISFLYSQDSSQSLPDGSFSGNCHSAMHTPEKKSDSLLTSFVDKHNSSALNDFSLQGFGPSEMYEKVWEYFYINGVFPPSSCMDRWTAIQKQLMMKQQSNVMNNGATIEGSSVNIHGSSSCQTNFQAADYLQTHSSSVAQHLHLPNSISFPLRITTEAAKSSDADQEIVNHTHKCDHKDNKGGTRVRLSSGQIPSGSLSINFTDERTPGSKYTSPLDLLTNAEASMETEIVKDVLSPAIPSIPPQFIGTSINIRSHPSSQTSVSPSIGECNHNLDMMSSGQSHQQSSSDGRNNYSHQGNSFMSPKINCLGTLSSDSQSISYTPSKPVMQTSGSFLAPTLGRGPDEPTFTMMDPSVVRCEWQDNEENFHDPGIGGVAIALTHGAVLFEVAKRELHATTALKNPNRYQPTRISLVFYQHKNLNYYHHGYYEYERKLAAQRKKRIEKLMAEGASAEEAEKAVKPGRKQKKKEIEGEEEEDNIDFAKTSAAQYRYMWDTRVRHGMTLTTDSIITRWIDPQPMVTGPYQRWV